MERSDMMNPVRFVKQLQLVEGMVVRIAVSRVEVYQQPNQFSQVQCALLEGVCLSVRAVQRVVEKSIIWIKIDCGWIIATDGGDDALLEIIPDSVIAEKSWLEEKNKRERMAAAVAAMLVKSHSLPRAKRLARSILQHAQLYYPNSPLTISSRRSIEDAMIALGGLSALSKVEVFEFIKTAAARQSNPPQSVLDISKILCKLVFDRPTLWVVEDKNVLTTEDMRLRNNSFVMSAAEGQLELFDRHLRQGQELTSLHSELVYTALHAAADFGQTAIVARIIETGLSLNIREPKHGQTALHLAAHNGRREVVALLLAAGADRQLCCSRHLFPFQVAERQGHVECCEMLKLPPPAVSSLFVADISQHSASWQWAAPVIDPRTTPVVEEYCLEMQLIDIMDDLRDPPLVYTTLLFANVQGLTAARNYRTRIRCRAVSGWSCWSQWCPATTLADVPETPESVETLKTSINALLLHWFSPLRDHGREVDYYELEVTSAASTDSQKHSLTIGEDTHQYLKTRASSKEQNNKSSAISKCHRILKHKNINLLKKYVTGLEPNRPYQCRVRAHNQCGFSPWSAWSQPTSPRVGVSVKSFDLSNAAVTVEWFQPQLCGQRSIRYFELQLCRLKGPLSVEVDSTQPHGSSQQQLQDAEDYVTICDTLTQGEYKLEHLRAGGRYQVRVRFMTNTGEWLDWADAVKSDPFTLPSAPPDPPINVRPRSINKSKNGNIHSDDSEINELLPEHHSVAGVTHSLSSPNQAVDDVADHEDLDVMHDYITIEWVSGSSNGEQVTAYEVEMAHIRSYHAKDVVSARDAFLGLSAKDHDSTTANKSLISEYLSWKSVTTEGTFLAPQVFKMPNLRPGSAYAFRVRQRNACGWSEFSNASPLICTFVSLPPNSLRILDVGAFFGVLCWEEANNGKSSSFTTLEIEVQTRLCSSNKEEEEEEEFSTWSPNISQILSRSELSTHLKDTSLSPQSVGCKLRNLVEAQWYEARVRIRTVVGWSPWSFPSERFCTLR